MVQHAIIIEISNSGAGEIGAIRAARNARLFGRTRSDCAFAAEGRHAAIRDAAIAKEVFLLKLHFSGRKLLHDSFEFRLILLLGSEVHRARAAV
jgi:hypothetical protein